LTMLTMVALAGATVALPGTKLGNQHT